MDRYDSGRRQSANASRSVLGFWVPVVLTASAAVIGVTAWIMSERTHDESEEESNVTDSDRHAARSTQKRPDYDVPSSRHEAQATGVVDRVSGVLRRTPSPQQLYDGASKKLAAGAAAAGAAAASALAAIREEDKEEHLHYGADAPDDRRPAPASATTSAISPATSRSAPAPSKTGRRKTAVIVISAETHLDSLNDGSEGVEPEQMSILSTLGPYADKTRARIFVLIYAPEIKDHPLGAESKKGQSVSSSYSNIGTDEANDSDATEKPLESLDPRPLHSPSSGVLTPRTPALSAIASAGFNALYNQALDLVEDDTMVMPFTTLSGHVQILKQLSPDVVYIQESLTGANGEVVNQLKGWVGQIGVVVGAEGLTAGIVDSEDETIRGEKNAQAWWTDGARVGLGKGCEVVEGIRIGEDWARRVDGKD